MLRNTSAQIVTECKCNQSVLRNQKISTEREVTDRLSYSPQGGKSCTMTPVKSREKTAKTSPFLLLNIGNIGIMLKIMGFQLIVSIIKSKAA